MEKTHHTAYGVGPQNQSHRDPQTFCKSVWQSYTPPCTLPSFSSINYQRFTSAFRHHKMSYMCIENPLTLFDTLWDLLKMTRLEQGNQIAIGHGITKSLNKISANLRNNWSSDIVSSSLATTKKKLATFHLSLSYWANPDWFPGTLRPTALPRLPLRRPPPPVVKERLYS